MRRPFLIALGLSVTLPACDPRAKSSEVTAAGVVGGAPQNPSRERESCASTDDCETGLRCVERTCRRVATSRLGEYHWVAGEVAFERNKINDAVESFQLSVNQFETDKVDPPAGLLCSYGAALRRRHGDARAAEQSARMLHRCLLASAPGTAEHTRALRELVELESAGLEPSLLQRDTPADTYLVRAPQRPSTDALKIDVAQTTASRDKGYAGWVAVLASPETRRLLVPCFERYWNETQKERLVVTIPLKLRARLGDDDIYEGGTLELGADPTVSGAEASASECIRGALGPAASEFAKSGSSGSWQGVVTLTLSAGG